MKIAAFLLVCLCVSASLFAQQHNGQITVDGLQRSFISYVPAGATTKMPLLICLHGRLGTAERMIRTSDFRPLADQDKFILIYPDGINKSWNDGRDTPAHKKGIDDVKFIARLISYVINTCNTDPERVYIAGMSNGGFMASRLACELSDRIAAVAVVAASMDLGMAYKPVKPVSVLYIQGTKDPLVPFNGGQMRGAGGEIYAHAAILKLWTEVDHCTNTPLISNLPDTVNDGTSIMVEHHKGTGNTNEVMGITVINGGHGWPGEKASLPRFIVGTTSRNINACEVIWAFFKDKKLAGS